MPMIRNTPTPRWATHHPDGSWSCTDCGRASQSIDGVRGHRRACPGISGVASHVAEIVASVAPSQPNLSQNNGSQHAARANGPAASNQPGWRPVPYRVEMGSTQASQPAPVDQSVEIASLKQEVFRLREAVKQLAEVAANDIQHLSQTQAAQAQSQMSPIVYVIGGVAALGILAYALGAFDGAQDHRSVMGGRQVQAEKPSRSSLGDVLTTGSQVLSLVKNARGAFKI